MVFVKNEDKYDDDCAICQVNLKTNGVVIQLSCEGKHQFHTWCFNEWCEKKNPSNRAEFRITCPLCNQVFDDPSDCMDAWAEVNNALPAPLDMNEYISQSRGRSRSQSRRRRSRSQSRGRSRSQSRGRSRSQSRRRRSRSQSRRRSRGRSRSIGVPTQQENQRA